MLSSATTGCRRLSLSRTLRCATYLPCSESVVASVASDCRVCRFSSSHTIVPSRNSQDGLDSNKNLVRSLHSTEIVVENKTRLASPDDVGISFESLITNLEKVSTFNQGNGVDPNCPSWRWDVDFVRSTLEQYEFCLKYLHDQQQAGKSNRKEFPEVLELTQMLFLSSETTEHAFRSLLRCKIPTHLLSDKVRNWEKYIGALGRTKLTDRLSLQMLEANGKAGNVGRAVALLSIRKSRGFEPQWYEFACAIKAVEAAGLYFRVNRNIFLADKEQPQIDNPTRWLDAILLNMRERDFPLNTELATRMLNTFSMTGKSGKMTHYHYRVRRSPIYDDDYSNYDDRIAQHQNRPVKTRLWMKPPPPYHKIPSQVKGKLVLKPGTSIRQLKLERESDPDWSTALTAAIAFADSLTQGACGHDPVKLNLVSYTTLVKACINRGSLWRAMHILDDVLPAQGIQPDAITYNHLLSGLARVGDVPTSRAYFQQMLAKGIKPTHRTVEAVVDCLLNLGDVPSAITIVQDCFNQHSVLPPYTTHLKILEFALGTGLVYEAKRHVYFIQQLWKWEQNDYHTSEFVSLMKLTKKNPKLSKEALEKLFAYFGEQLDHSDFF